MHTYIHYMVNNIDSTAKMKNDDLAWLDFGYMSCRTLRNGK